MGNFTYLLNEIKNSLLEGKTYNDVCNMIVEELGVHDEVTKISFDIMEKLKEDLKKRQKCYYSDIPGASHKDGRFNFEALGKTIVIDYTFINYRDETYKKRYSNLIPNKKKNAFTRSNLVLSLTVEAVSGYIDIYTYADTIQHEIQHFFQEDKIGYSFGSTTWYKIATKCKQRPSGSLTYMIGDIIYLSLQCEEEAFTNGLYASLVYNYKHKNKPTIEVLDNSPIYNALLKMRKEVDILLQNKEDETLRKTLSTIKKITNGTTFNGIINMAKRAEKEIIRRIGKIIVKAQKDCDVANDMWANDNRRNVYTKESVNDLYNLKNPLDSSPLLKI